MQFSEQYGGCKPDIDRIERQVLMIRDSSTCVLISHISVKSLVEGAIDNAPRVYCAPH